jgi:hypothetical protein
MTFFLCVLAITIVFIAGVAALALTAAGVVLVAGAVAAVLGMASHRLVPWIVLALGVCALFFVNYAGAHENHHGSATRNQRSNYAISISQHDPLADFMFGGLRHDGRGPVRLHRIRFPSRTFAADLPASADPILPPSRFRARPAKRHSVLKRKEVMQIVSAQGRHDRSSGRTPAVETRPRLTSSAGADEPAIWELTRMCVDQMQEFLKWKREHPR